MAPGFAPINPLAGTKPIQPITPIMPTPAVTASPAIPIVPTVGAQTIGIQSPMFSVPMVGQPGQKPTPIAGESFPAYRDRLMQWDAMQKMYDDQQSAAQSEAERMRLLGERPDLSRLTLSRRAFENPFTLFNQGQ